MKHVWEYTKASFEKGEHDEEWLLAQIVAIDADTPWSAIKPDWWGGDGRLWI